MANSKEKTPVEYWLALSSVKGLGNVRINRLIAHFGSPKAIFDAVPSEIEQLPSFNSALASQICTITDDLLVFREQFETLRDQNIHVLTLDDPNYPAKLRTISDSPPILCRLGELTEINELCVAIVGTRKPTTEAIELTRLLARKLTEVGFTVVSGLAVGIDTCAHEEVLKGSEKTIAVLGTDVLNVYPSKNLELATNIQSQGCLLSEHPFPTSPTPRNLVQRNRIISGLSLATIVIEARESSGTLHTARFAQGQGKRLFACQWKNDKGREGTRILVRDGAVPFTPDRADEVVDKLQPPKQMYLWEER